MIPRPRLSVIVPTHDGADTLAACLQSLQSSQLPHEIVVVDDASSDESAEIAQRLGCRVVRLSKPVGAACAKNQGAEVAAGEILFFTDDDVVAPPQILERIARDLDSAQVAGVVGLLDRTVPFADFASNYKNLWMRFTYARLPRERIGVFYTSAAAIRRETFLQLGGFDPNYSGASIAEDTEFGQRAWGAGLVLVLDPEISVKHHKHYTLFEVLRTDSARARALTLMRLRKRGRPFFTSVPLFYQLAVPVLFAALAACLLAVLIPVPAVLSLAAGLWVVFYGLNAQWLAYLASEKSIAFALRAALFQPVDVAAVGAGMLRAGLGFVRGARY